MQVYAVFLNYKIHIRYNRQVEVNNNTNNNDKIEYGVRISKK